jgi:hypothetical protein
MSEFCVVENTPGYLPDSDPFECEDLEQAKAVAEGLADELEEDGYDISGNDDGTFYYAEREDDDRVIEIIEVPEGAGDFL